MAGSKKQRNKTANTHSTPNAQAGSRERELRKDFHYVLQMDSAESEVLLRYQTLLSQGAAQFAESYYNYLFDNPSIAEILYAFENDGGDVGDLVRSQLNQLLRIIGPLEDGDLIRIGHLHQQRGVKPVWLIGAYRLYLNHLLQLIAHMPGLEPDERNVLESALVKRVFLFMGLMIEGHLDRLQQTREAERTQQDGELERMQQLLANIPQQVWSYDVTAAQLHYLNPAARALCNGNGKGEGPIPCLMAVHEDDRSKAEAAWQQALDGRPAEVEVRLQGRGQSESWRRLSLYPFKQRRRVVRIDAMLEDINRQHETLERLEHLATTDELTELANRTLWQDRVNQALAQARREEHQAVVLMLLDLDHFKTLNDTLGHQAGDELLRQVAERVCGVLRDSDTLARLGGDEFGVLMPAVEDPVRAGEQVAGKILECFKRPYHYNDQPLYFTTSIGIAHAPRHGGDFDTLLSRADIAMYEAKRNELGFAFFEPGAAAASSAHLQFSTQLRHALERNEFELHYQPKVDIASHELCGAEALLRWKHPEQGLVPPGGFLDMAEQIGLMVPITNWVLVTALRQCKAWQQAGVTIPVSVNLSTRTFQTPRLLERIEWALQEAGVSGDCLEVEVTEQTLMKDLDHGAELLRRLHDLGVRVAIDDFGTGYSSVSRLRHLPLDTLKIDRSFLSEQAAREDDPVIVRSIIDLGHNLGLQVLGEGVENDTAWNLLESLGCDAVQGYHVSQPLSDQGFSSWIQDGGWSNRIQ
ncbi:signal transduction protein [Thiohalobacter thiocyanaticus]|uniref:Diguanylate cyclase DosC n=1 Tax=Thiohalobacter thiocyanaticus TaxID=585455 RepID=A0A1Z4VRP0_9GAMM|nr:signal transduction protein [Thiohalobacter thiocyanaticus]